MGNAYLQVVKPLPERGKWFGFFCHMLHVTFNKNTQCQVAFPSALCLLALQSHKGLFLPGMRSEFGSLLKDDDVVLLCSEEYLLLQSSINHKYQHNGSAYWAKGDLTFEPMHTRVFKDSTKIYLLAVNLSFKHSTTSRRKWINCYGILCRGLFNFFSVC